MQIISINPQFESHRAFIENIADNGIPAAAEIVYQNNRNKIFKTADQGVEFNIKAFKVPNALNSYAYTTVRQSKARRSFEYATRLRKLGINTPEPVAYIEKRDGLKLKESYYISLQIAGEEMRDWEKKPDNKNLLRALAKDMVKLHRLGVLHKDFSPGNMLFNKNKDGEYEFYYVDLNRMKFDVHSHAKQMTNFKSINLNEDETKRLARLYAAAAGLDAEKTADEAAAQLRKYKKKKERLKKIKKLFKRAKRDA